VRQRPQRGLDGVGDRPLLAADRGSVHECRGQRRAVQPKIHPASLGDGAQGAPGAGIASAAAPFTSPAEICPERTVVTAGLSKNLALGGWRLGVARLPGGGLGPELRARLLGIGGEIWSAPAEPVQPAGRVLDQPPVPPMYSGGPAPGRGERGEQL